MSINRLLIVFFLTAPAIAQAAIQNADPEDFDYVAEHLAEAQMNNRYLSLPFAMPGIEKGRWVFKIQPSYSATKVDFMNLKGPMLAASAGHVFHPKWTVRAIGFYDRLKFSGGPGSNLMNPLFSRSIPLDFPEYAEFSNFRGDYVQWGLGPVLDWEFSSKLSKRRFWVLSAGALWNRLDLKNYQVDYRMTSGADAGKSGVLDHSARYDYVTPFFSVQYTRGIGPHFSISPRFIAGAPLPKRGWIGQITGPGFDVSGDTKEASNGSPMGDGYAGFGLDIRHEPSGLSVDIGTSIYQALFERKVHEGIEQVILVNISWSFTKPSAPPR